MFPSSNNYSNPCPPLTHTTMTGISFSGDKQQHPAGSSLEEHDHDHNIHHSPFFHFPTPFFDDHDDDDDGLLMSHLLSQANQQMLVTPPPPPPDSQINAAPSPIKETKKVPKKRSTTGNGTKQGNPRKRTGKKDRHSKIYTAHGPRDRRMRLSLQIARKFFDLQDMLGFDKASKTIEWLFSKSKVAIKELTEKIPALKHSTGSGDGRSVSSTSESEVVSAAKCQGVLARGESMRSTATGRVIKERKSRKVVLNHVDRESRDKARARARERTREKMKMRGLDKTNNCSDESNPNELKRLQPSSPLEIGVNSGLVVAEEEEKPHHSTVQSHSLENQMDYVSTIEKFLGITGSSSMFNYSNHIADSTGETSAENCPVFSGNWGINNERIQYRYCAMTNIKDSTGNTQEQNPSSSAKMMNPTSILMSTSDIGLLHSDYHENPAVASKIYHNFYQ